MDIIIFSASLFIKRRPTTWVHHGKYLEDKLLSQLERDPVFRDQEIDQALNHQRGGALSGLLPSHHHHHPLPHALLVLEQLLVIVRF